jgi:selenocysteine lyase/cysteine desulfurase
MDSTTAAKFAEVRKLFPHAGKIVYFNTASYGPFCTPVADAIRENLDLRLTAERDDSHDAFVNRDWLRNAYADMIGADARQIGIGMNTSHGLNVAAFGLPLQQGDEVLLSDIEFPAAAYVFRAASESRGLEIHRLESRDMYFDIDLFERAIGKRTRVLAVSWVQFFNGYKNDLAEIAAVCKKHEIFLVVDGIQGMGVEPISIQEVGVDVFSAGCQKWMLSPQGCGFFYLSDKVRDRIKPPFMSWLGADWGVKFTDLFHYDKPYFDSAERFELGYYVTLNLLGMQAAVRIFQELGIENIRDHNYALIDRLVAYIESNPYYSVTSSMIPKHRSSLVTFTCDDLRELHRAILKSGIICVRREGSIRVSVHLFNNEDDIDRLIGVLDDFFKRR